MSSDESTDDQFDDTDLPSTLRYDFQDIPASPPLNQTVSSTTTLANAAPPHAESGSNSIHTFQEQSSGESYFGRLDNSLDSQELGDPREQARQRLFRSRSSNMESDIGIKRKYGFFRSEAAVERRNLNRGHSDLTNLTSNRSAMIPGYSDVQPFRGRIDQKERRYVENDINVEGLAASLDSSNISSGETLLHVAKMDSSYSTASVNSSVGLHRSSSFGHSDHSTNSLPSNPTFSYSGPESEHSALIQETSDIPATAPGSSTNADTTAATAAIAQTSPPSPPSPLPLPASSTSGSEAYHVESSCPIDDLAFRQELETSSSQHLQDYSPERPDNFAQEVARLQSSTPLRPQIASTFPDEDFANLRRPLHNDGTQDDDNNGPDGDTTPPYSQQFEAPSVQNIDEMTSPFLDQQQQLANQPPQASSSSSRPDMVSTTGDKTPLRSARSTVRRLRSNSDLGDAAGASHATSLYCIMFASSIDSQKYHKYLHAMGAMVVTNWELCTHFVTDSICRKTVNLLCALTSKKWIVSERWMEQSVAKARFEDENDYVLIRQTTPNEFFNKKLFFCPSAKIKRSDAQELAKAAGAKMRIKEPDLEETVRALVVVTSGTPEETRRYENAGYETMERDAFLERYGRSDA